MPAVVMLGAAYSANKGAASMLEALVDRLPSFLSRGPATADATFVAVSTHPEGDRRSLERAGLPVAVASQRPFELLALHVPLALLAGGLRRARLPWRWTCRPEALRAIAKADVVADLSGISFVDGRRTAVLVYNTLVIAVPLLLGRPVVKCSQAMGPVRTPLNRRLARLVLPRLRAICPRGAVTAAHLREFGLTNLVPANDLAFALEVPEEVRVHTKVDLADRAGPGPYLVVSPSQVVDSYCRGAGIDYQAVLVDFIDAAVARTDLTVVVIAHSAQADAGVNHMNDLPLCRAIHSRLRRRDQVVLFDDDLLPGELRAIIGCGDVLVTSRFHAMISALAETTPLLVIGWSHKYAEILGPFGLGDAAIGYDELTDGAAVLARTRDVLDRADAIRDRIREHLPTAREETDANFAALDAALHPVGGGGG